MNGFIKAKYFGYLLALLLAIALTSTVGAQTIPGPGDPGFDPGSGGPSGPGDPGNEPGTGTQPDPNPGGGGNGNGPGNGPGDPGGEPGNGNGNGNGNGMNGDKNGGMNGDKNGETMHKPGPRAHEASGRIVMHAATPAQLVKSGDGLQYYFVGADGSTVTGPTIPSFAALAEMYPSGAWVPLVDAPNPLTGKHVNVDYIPSEMKIRVYTYYPDNEYDTNKPYAFNFGSDYVINVEAW